MSSPPSVDLRQKIGTDLNFVTLTNDATFTKLVINSTGVALGTYNLFLESFNTITNGLLRTENTVNIHVYDYVRSSPITSPIFILKGNSEILLIDQIVQTIGQPITPTFYVRQSIAALVFV